MNFHSDTYLQEKVKERHISLSEKDPRIFATFYKGSANYLLDTENSDIDTLSIACPSLDDIVKRNNIGYEESFDNGIAAVIDVRDFGKNLLKHCRTEIEAIFTRYFYVGTGYAYLVATLRLFASKITDNQKIRSIYVSKAIASQFEKKFLLSLENEVTSYSCKALANFLREISFMVNLIEGKPYDQSMQANDSVIYGVKKGILPRAAAIQLFEIYQCIKNDIDKQGIPDNWKEFSEQGVNVVEDFVYNCMRKSLSLVCGER